MYRNLTLLFFLISHVVFTQNSYDLAVAKFNELYYSDALEQINEVLESDHFPENYLLRAMINEAMGNNTNAQSDYTKAITLDREYYEAYFQFSEFLFSTYEFERAIASLNFLLNRINGGDTKGVFVKYDIHGQEGTKITSLIGMKAEILDKRGQAYQKLGRLEEARMDFDNAIEISQSPDKLVNRALLQIEFGNENEASADLKKAIELVPDYALAWYNLLVLDPDIELPILLSIYPEFAPMLSIKGLEAFESDDYVKAGKLFRQALLLTPDDPVLLLNVGRLDQRNRAFASAQKKFEKVLRLAPEKHEALYLLGNSYFGQKDYLNALKYYQQYLRNDPTNGQIWFNSGMAYLELKDSENACKCLSRSSDLGMKRSTSFVSQYCTTE